MISRRQFAMGALATTAIGLPALSRAQDGPVTLRVWDSFADEGVDVGMRALIATFEAQNPGIKIQRDAQTTDSLRPVMQTALASGTGPDVLYYDTGPGYGKVLADAGLLLPLDDAYADGAFSHVYDWTRARTTYGSKTYGVANELETYWAFYNADLFKQLGLEAPKTYAEFLTICATVKAAGASSPLPTRAAGQPITCSASTSTTSRARPRWRACCWGAPRGTIRMSLRR
jgi:ABC-type glycerol-3-phosphate transport system substrate-binding protein